MLHVPARVIIILESTCAIVMLCHQFFCLDETKGFEHEVELSQHAEEERHNLSAIRY